ncbi:MAG: hypothetical protein R3B70_44865 [Polyangiaceae bacterium]
MFGEAIFVAFELAGFEADEVDDMPEYGGDIAFEFVAAVGGECGPALGGGDEDSEARISST